MSHVYCNVIINIVLNQWTDQLNRMNNVPLKQNNSMSSARKWEGSEG